MLKLTFGKGNAKLLETIATFSLPSGWTCPGANECLSRANKETGTITDGKETKFRCFSASQEALYPTLRKARWKNFEMMKRARTVEGMVNLIMRDLPKNITKVRVHVAGDFFSETYFQAWLKVAKLNPGILFYGYTKMVNFLVEYKNFFPHNFRFVASWGGKHDDLIETYDVKSARVVFSEVEASQLGLELDHHDDHAYSSDNQSFALLIHGTQKAGTPASVAWSLLKKQNKGYSKKRRYEQKMY